jgi:hypothetical protein
MQGKAQLSVIAYNLGNLWRRLVLPKRFDNWSLSSLQQRLVKTGGRLVKHARYYWLLLAESHLGLQPSRFGPFSLSAMVGTTVCCLRQGLNACTHRLLHQFFRHRRVPGVFSSIFLPPWSLGYPVGTGSRAVCPAWPQTAAACNGCILSGVGTPKSEFRLRA